MNHDAARDARADAGHQPAATRIGRSDSIKEMLALLRDLGGQVCRVTPRDEYDMPLFTLLLVDAPDAEQMRDLDQLQAKWDAQATDNLILGDGPASPAVLESCDSGWHDAAAEGGVVAHE